MDRTHSQVVVAAFWAYLLVAVDLSCDAFQNQRVRGVGLSESHSHPVVFDRRHQVVLSLSSREGRPKAKAAKKKKAKKQEPSEVAVTVASDDKELYTGPTVELPDILNFDLTGGRPGAIIETEEQLKRKEEIFQEIESGERTYPEFFSDYGTLDEELEAEYDNDDPDAIDASTLGQWDITDLEARFDYEWDPLTNKDPNVIEDNTDFVKETEKDEEGVEVGYDPMFGPSNPIDTRTKLGAMDSYMIDDKTRNDDILPPQFPEGDLEIEYNADVVKFRKSMDIIETYTDEFLPDTMRVPRHVAKWYGYPEPMKYPQKEYTNNRYTKLGKLTNFDAMTPFDARTRAVELARAKNAEWMPEGTSLEWHKAQRKVYEEYGTLVGSLKKGECDPDIVELIQPALRVLGSCAELLSIELGTVFRFHYHGLIKNKFGMECWTETLIRDCGVEVTGVIFETGFRKRDPAYDGGDPYHKPIF